MLRQSLKSSVVENKCCLLIRARGFEPPLVTLNQGLLNINQFLAIIEGRYKISLWAQVGIEKGILICNDAILQYSRSAVTHDAVGFPFCICKHEPLVSVASSLGL